jgi:hypothetical protein
MRTQIIAAAMIKDEIKSKVYEHIEKSSSNFFIIL